MKHFLLITLFLISFQSVVSQVTDFAAIDFTKADSIAEVYKNENLYNLPILSYKLTSKLNTDVEKFRAIYTWVSTNIESDYGYFIKHKKKLRKFKNDSIGFVSWNKTFQPKVFNKLLKEQKTVCTGYAYLIQQLADFATINCKIINGYGRTVNSNIGDVPQANHSWNAVELNNKWYLCDATWSSGSFLISGSNSLFIKNYNDGYFLTDPKMFSTNHFPLYTNWFLFKNPPDLDTFANAPLVYNKAFQHKIYPISPDRMKLEVKKGDVINFNFQLLKPIDKEKFKIELYGRVTEPEIKIENNILTFEQKFTKKGLHDLHIKMGKDYIITYSVKVFKP